jgi:putative hydroxymethylpyrimidine transport system ATP-binding protein
LVTPAQTTEHSAPVEVQVRGVSKSFPRDGGRLEVLHDLDLSVPAGSFVSILGPSGSGKSTLLGILAGLDNPDSGEIILGPPALSSNPQSAIRNPQLQVGYMPQRDLLLPWRTALDNATVALEVSGVQRREARVRVLPMFDEFGLSGFAGSYPAELSGGMRQRVSFLRSAVLARGLMLLDEPFGALDALTRASMHEWLLATFERLGSTFIFVTHDVEEAILLSDMVYVLSPRPGRVVGLVKVDLPRPRTLDSTTDERFLPYRKQLLDLLRATGGLALSGEAR